MSAVYGSEKREKRCQSQSCLAFGNSKHDRFFGSRILVAKGII